MMCSVTGRTGGGCGTRCGNDGSALYYCCGTNIQTRCRCQ
jgi:hypothetical protein